MAKVGKLVVLKLDGDLSHQGFRVFLEIGPDGDRPFIEVVGALPAAPALVTALNQWQQAYRHLGTVTRIMPQEIIYGGSVNRLHDCQYYADRLRDRFHLWLESPQFRDVDRRLREALSIDDPIRILIRTPDRDLWRLPWHLWDLVEHYAQAEIALATATLQQRAAVPVRSNQNVRILAILGDRTGISVDADRELLEQLPDAEMTLLVEPSRGQITQQLWDQPWDLLFFAGHSQTAGNQGWLNLNPQESLTLDELKYGLRWAIANGLQLAIFNSCDGLGLAQELEQLQLPQMIVMREPVPDPVAQAFLKQFLIAFVQGESLYLAERRARERLQGLESEFPCASWLPVIFQHSTNPPLLWRDLLGDGTAALDDRLPTAPETQPQATPMPAPLVPLDRPVAHGKVCATRSVRSLLFISWLITCLTVGLRLVGGLQPSELWALGQLMRLRPSDGLDQRLLIVKATEQDFQQLKEDPLSDRTVTQLLQKLQLYQPSVVGLDLYRDIPQGSGRSDLLEVLKHHNQVVAACKIPDRDDAGIAPPPGLPTQRLGFTDVVVDPNQIIRRQLLSVSPKLAAPCATGYALSFLLAATYLQALGYPSTITADNDWQFGNVVLRRLRSPMGGYQRFDTSGSQILLNYRTPIDVAQQVTVSELLHDPNPTYIKDRIVLIGVDTDNKDRYFTPYSRGQNTAQTVPGVVIHAQMVSQILSAVMDHRPLLWAWPMWEDVLWIGVWSLSGGLLSYFLRSPLYVCFAGSVMLIFLGSICFSVLKQGGWIPLVPAAIAFVTTTGAVLVVTTAQVNTPIIALKTERS